MLRLAAAWRVGTVVFVAANGALVASLLTVSVVKSHLVLLLLLLLAMIFFAGAEIVGDQGNIMNCGGWLEVVVVDIDGRMTVRSVRSNLFMASRTTNDCRGSLAASLGAA